MEAQIRAPSASSARKRFQLMPDRPASGAATTASPGTQGAATRARPPYRVKRSSVRRTQESGSMEMRQMRRSTAPPRIRPAQNHTECPTIDARTESATICGKASRPDLASTPAPTSSGAAGTGAPSWSHRAAANRTTYPWRRRNPAIRFKMLQPPPDSAAPPDSRLVVAPQHLLLQVRVDRIVAQPDAEQRVSEVLSLDPRARLRVADHHGRPLAGDVRDGQALPFLEVRDLLDEPVQALLELRHLLAGVLLETLPHGVGDLPAVQVAEHPHVDALDLVRPDHAGRVVIGRLLQIERGHVHLEERLLAQSRAVHRQRAAADGDALGHLDSVDVVDDGGRNERSAAEYGGGWRGNEKRCGGHRGDHGSLLRCWSKKANTRCQSRACSAGSAMMCVVPASGRNSNFLPARNSVSASSSDSLKCTLSSAVPWMIRSGRDRSLAYVTDLSRPLLI